MKAPEILTFFLQKNLNVSKEALNYIVNSKFILDDLRSLIRQIPEEITVVTIEIVQEAEKIVSSTTEIPEAKKAETYEDKQIEKETEDTILDNEKTSLQEPQNQIITQTRPLIKIETIKDIPDKISDKPDVKTFRRRAIVAHVGDKSSIFFNCDTGLNVSCSYERLTELPVFSTVIGYGH